MADASVLAPISPRAPAWSRAHVALVLLVLGAVLWSLTQDQLWPENLTTPGGRAEFARFFAAATSPALFSEGQPHLSLVSALREGVVNTVAVAFAAIGIAVLFGFAFGCAASDAFWDRDPVPWRSPLRQFGQSALRRGFLVAIRTVMAAMRSVHELIWALLLTGMFGVNLLCGILALAIPYAATLGRIYAEILDETPRDAARALRAAGATDGAIFLFGLLPRALPAMLSYTFYRFDCAVRSSAVLGFVGFPTLGLYIRNSFNYAYYHEVWTWLYVLFGILALTEVMSAAIRKRTVR